MAKYSYHRLDGNAKEIRDGLRKVGATVDARCPLDWLVGFQGVNYLMEVKTATGKLRATQEAFIGGWSGQVSVVRTLDEALAVIGVTA